ncbi:hypothetical protein [Microcoleus sp. BROC3]
MILFTAPWRRAFRVRLAVAAFSVSLISCAVAFTDTFSAWRSLFLDLRY